MQKTLYTKIISEKFSYPLKGVENTIRLLEDGATIPFISRYRKELTGNLDETAVDAVRQELDRLVELNKRRESILRSIEEQGALTEELKKAIGSAENLAVLEDLYLPYKPKRRTRALIAKSKGLEPLAEILIKQNENAEQRAGEFLNDEVKSSEEALQGARDIIAEWINEDIKARGVVRKLFEREAVIFSRVAKGKIEEGAKYSDYFNFEEKLNRCPSHRLLAMRRGEEEGFLRLTVEPPEEKALEMLKKLFIRGAGSSSDQVAMAVTESYKRLLKPSIENEYRSLSKEKADEEAIKVFVSNLRQLLLAPPLGRKNVMAIDPGYRSGCKVVCLDAQGNLLHNETIYPHKPQGETKVASKKITTLTSMYKIEAIAVGNATAGRETENFIRKVKFDREVEVFVVNESGASVYSASKTAREEFPDYDVTVRGAVSIGRRLMDPLAELVKIDPKSIGVGQYQHDVDQGKLKDSLDREVESCVNLVGVNLNTASKHLLTYISGLGPQIAQNIVDLRKENGRFTTREELKSVPRLGEKAFEQCAGFLRIEDGPRPLDNSAVHPESYHVVERMALDTGATVEDLIKKEELRKKIDIKKYVTDETGLPTLNDIMKELEKPGRDPRTKIEVFEFSKDVFSIEDLKQGMVLPGIVTNITNFGAFVDVGVKQDGLVHISRLADRFVRDPNEVVKLNQTVTVKVIEVDVARKRIQLSIKDV